MWNGDREPSCGCGVDLKQSAIIVGGEAGRRRGLNYLQRAQEFRVAA
jgi:hypothetical protein